MTIYYYDGDCDNCTSVDCSKSPYFDNGHTGPLDHDEIDVEPISKHGHIPNDALGWD